MTDEWSTLVNPDRDLGPQAIHGIKDAEVRRAPRFGQIAGDVAERLAGRIVVAHNWPFDAMHVRAQFERPTSTPHCMRVPVCAPCGRPPWPNFKTLRTLLKGGVDINE